MRVTEDQLTGFLLDHLDGTRGKAAVYRHALMLLGSIVGDVVLPPVPQAIEADPVIEAVREHHRLADAGDLEGLDELKGIVTRALEAAKARLFDLALFAGIDDGPAN